MSRPAIRPPCSDPRTSGRDAVAVEIDSGGLSRRSALARGGDQLEHADRGVHILLAAGDDRTAGCAEHPQRRRSSCPPPDEPWHFLYIVETISEGGTRPWARPRAARSKHRDRRQRWVHLTHDAITLLFRPAHREPRGPAGRRFDGIGLWRTRSSTDVQYYKFSNRPGGGRAGNPCLPAAHGFLLS